MTTTCDVDCIDHAAARAGREAADQLDLAATGALLRAVADPTRLRLLAAIASQPDLCACDLAWIVDRQKSLVSHHVRQLREAGLIEQRREGRLVRFTSTAAGVALLGSIVQLAGEQVAA